MSCWAYWIADDALEFVPASEETWLEWIQRTRGGLLREATIAGAKFRITCNGLGTVGSSVPPRVDFLVHDETGCYGSAHLDYAGAAEAWVREVHRREPAAGEAANGTPEQETRSGLQTTDRHKE